MTVCSRIKGFTRTHEWIADSFSLLAVMLLFASIWAGIEYQAKIFELLGENLVLYAPLLVAIVLLDVFLIFAFLNIGSTRFTDQQDGRCFHTFRGRRHGGVSIGNAVSNWINHIEQVNKKHR